MHYSIVIPAWNEASFITTTLQAVFDAVASVKDEKGLHGEVIVVDNNSTDDTAILAENMGATVVAEPINQIARARNRGAKSARGEMLVFIDADTIVSDVVLADALSRLYQNKVVGGGSIIATDKPVSSLTQAGIRAWNRLSVSGGLAAGCFLFCRRDAFESIGCFNQRVYAGEEIFLSRALKRWGRRHGMQFHIVQVDPVRTSVRKLEWYSPFQLVRQAVVVFVPGAIFSKAMCKTWYEKRERPR